MLHVARIEEAIRYALQRPDLDETGLLLWLRRQFPPLVASQAVQQFRLRQRARRKFSRADQMWFTPEGLEQSSSEVLATYHASRYPQNVLTVDAGCGIGGDLIALAKRGETAGVERDPLCLQYARRNVEVYQVEHNCRFVHADLLRLRLQEAPFLFMDPARRTGGRRSSSSDEWQPNWATVCRLALSVRGALVKTSPALSPELIPLECEREYVSVDGECRELLLAFGECKQGASLSALVLPEGARLIAADAPAPVMRAPMEWIYDPDPAIVAAHLLPELAQILTGYLLHPRIAYLTAERYVHTPFARAYRLIERFPYSRKRLFERLRALRAGSLTVKKRGVNISPEQLVRAWHPVGERRITVILYRSDTGVNALLAESPSPCA
ncbi:MAG: class I SAM-dependent methyltransferase [Armatimonadota bacterium]|nr:methyltransferase domain-containing protein [bacterium]MDW8321588.1 class I SAM-dependent methyltransferase [Armatimonadota bacterium]